MWFPFLFFCFKFRRKSSHPLSRDQPSLALLCEIWDYHFVKCIGKSLAYLWPSLIFQHSVIKMKGCSSAFGSFCCHLLLYSHHTFRWLWNILVLYFLYISAVFSCFKPFFFSPPSSSPVPNSLKFHMTTWQWQNWQINRRKCEYNLRFKYQAEAPKLRRNA